MLAGGYGALLNLLGLCLMRLISAEPGAAVAASGNARCFW